jgi:hypothetical protein
MTDPYVHVIAIANVCLIVFAVALAALGVWAIRGHIPAKLRARYPPKVVLLSHLPLTENWRRIINAEDLPAFLESRRRRFILAIAILLMMQLLTAYAFLHATAAVWRCESSRAGILPGTMRR